MSLPGAEELAMLYHVTTPDGWRGIRTQGIMPSCSRRTSIDTYLVSPARLAHAVDHVCQRHKVKSDNLVALWVKVPVYTLIRTSQDGIWRTVRHIAIGRIGYAGPVSVLLDGYRLAGKMQGRV